MLLTQAELGEVRAHTFPLVSKTHIKYIICGVLAPGSAAFKVGRTTRLTAGVVHAIPIITNYAWRTKEESKRKTEAFQPRESIKVSIDLPANTSRSAGKRIHVETSVIKGFGNDPFNLGADSGLWILNSSGHLVGLLWGGCSGSGDCYFSAIINMPQTLVSIALYNRANKPVAEPSCRLSPSLNDSPS